MDLESERKVSFEEAARLAYSLKIQYIETSAFLNLKCQEPFEILTKEILMFRNGKKYQEYKKNIKIKRKIDANYLPSLLKFINI